MKANRKFCAVRQQEEGKSRHAVSKFKIVTIKITVEDSKICNIASVSERLKIISNKEER